MGRKALIVTKNIASVTLQQSEYEITITISYMGKEESHQIGCSSREKIPGDKIKYYTLVYERIKLAIFEDDKFVEIEIV